jgi:hypothetical protein
MIGLCQAALASRADIALDSAAAGGYKGGA